MLQIKRLAACLVVLGMLFIGCTGVHAEDKLDVVCTSFPCYDFVRAVAGEKANIRMLIKPGAEVHSFEPTPADVMAIAGCDLFVYIGGESDAWVLDILDSFGNSAPRSLRFFDCVETEESAHEHAHEADHEHAYDEHIWTSQAYACTMIEALAEEICEVDSENAELYRQNALAYEGEIGKLNAEILEVVKNAARTEMVFADRFPFMHFANEYGIEWYAAFPSCASESEPSAKTIMELIKRVISDKIPVIYTLEMSSGKTAQTIAEETGAKILTFHSMQNVTEAEFTSGETYITLMQKNIAALKEGLN